MVMLCCSAQLLHQQDVACPLSKLTTMVNRTRKECGASTLTCPLNCALRFEPLYHDCHSILSSIYDADDGLDDGNAASLTAFSNKCQQQDKSLLTARINRMIARGCNVNVSSIYATPPSKCKDDSAAMKKVTGLDCAHVGKQSMHAPGVEKSFFGGVCVCGGVNDHVRESLS